MMTHYLTRTILIITLALIPWAAGAADKAPKAPAPPAKSEGLGIVASGAVEDTREACVARIPKDATSGQRMIAEQSCKRDQESRQPIQDVPGR